jgi:hypothetical protein
VCSETCVGRIRYLGVLLYDADRIQEAASVENDRDLYQAQLDIFLDPNDPEGDRAGAHRRHPDSWMEAARIQPGLQDGGGVEGGLPLHPEYRTLPMVWYVPPLSPIMAKAVTAGRRWSICATAMKRRGWKSRRTNCRIICRCSSNISVHPARRRPAEELAQPGVIISALANGWRRKTRPMPRRCGMLADLAGAGGEQLRDRAA